MDDDDAYIPLAAPARRATRQARVSWAGREVTIGGGAPVRVQAMTNTDTVDAIGTAIQVKELAQAGFKMAEKTAFPPNFTLWEFRPDAAAAPAESAPP